MMKWRMGSGFQSLFAAVFFLFAGFGLFLNSAGVELSQRGVGSTVIGVLNAAFFVGAALSAVAAHRVVSSVGHIRAFSVFGALFAIAALGHMMTDLLWVWGLLRVLLGFCYYSLLMVVESWLAERSSQEQRAKMLALYNVVYYVSVTAGIGLLSLHLSSAAVFTLAAMMVMAAMLPVALTKLDAPEMPPRQRISLPRLFSVAPLALVGSTVAGLLMNGFFTMASVFLLKQGYQLPQISAYLAAAMVAGFVVQLPVAKLSDKYGRRNAIMLGTAVTVAAALGGIALLLGGWGGAQGQYAVAAGLAAGSFTLYALSVARANDRLPKGMNTVEVSRSLLFSYGMGSLCAPMILGVAMDQASRYGFYVYFVLLAAALFVFAWKQESVPKDERAVYVNVPATGPVSADLDPRNHSGVLKPFDEHEAQHYSQQMLQRKNDSNPPENS